jgi:hypothetical protein
MPTHCAFAIATRPLEPIEGMPICSAIQGSHRVPQSATACHPRFPLWIVWNRPEHQEGSKGFACSVDLPHLVSSETVRALRDLV